MGVELRHTCCGARIEDFWGQSVPENVGTRKEGCKKETEKTAGCRRRQMTEFSACLTVVIKRDLTE
jgi:hypothetical protein